MFYTPSSRSRHGPCMTNDGLMAGDLATTYSEKSHYQSLVGLLNGFHAARVLVLGDVMLDRFVYGSVERISPEAPIPVVSVDRVSDMPGGAANVARNIADLGS